MKKLSILITIILSVVIFSGCKTIWNTHVEYLENENAYLVSAVGVGGGGGPQGELYKCRKVGAKLKCKQIQ